MALTGLLATAVQAQKLQVVHNAPGISTADIYVLDGSTVEATLDDIPFRGAIVLNSLPTSQSLEVRLNESNSTGASDTGTRLATANITLSNNTDSFGQVFAVGDGENTSYDLVTQPQRSTVSPSGSGFVDVLIGHQSPDAGAVDVLTRGAIPTNGNGNSPDGLTENSFSPQNNTSSDEDYYTLPFEDYIFRVGEDNNSAFLAAVRAQLTSTSSLDGKTITLLASGYVTPSDESNVSNPPSFALAAVPSINLSTNADEPGEANNADANVRVLNPDPDLQALVINEYFADPGASQDTDNDGDTQNDSGEEFIEILNISGADIDVSGYTIKDAAGNSYTFPGGTVIPGGEAATIFIGGASPTNIPGFTDTGSPQLNNSGREDIFLADNNSKLRDHITYDAPSGVSTLSPQNNQESATRFPDGTGFAVNHTQTSSNESFTPGYETDGTTPLPVELARFNARVDGQRVVLSWKTLSETNNAGFEVQQKIDDTFQDVGYVEGAGTTSQVQSYRYTVDDLMPGTHTFRLRQMDIDGSASYSSAIRVTVGMEGAFTLSEVSPNPVQETATIDLAVKRTQDVTVTLYNTLGQRVRTFYEGPMPGGQQYEATISADELSSGVYLLRVRGENFSETRRITIVR